MNRFNCHLHIAGVEFPAKETEKSLCSVIPIPQPLEQLAKAQKIPSQRPDLSSAMQLTKFVQANLSTQFSSGKKKAASVLPQGRSVTNLPSNWSQTRTVLDRGGARGRLSEIRFGIISRQTKSFLKKKAMATTRCEAFRPSRLDVGSQHRPRCEKVARIRAKRDEELT